MNNRHTDLNQDFLSCIKRNDPSAMSLLTVKILDDIGQLGLLFRRPDFSSADIPALINQINASIAYILGDDNFKKERATFRDQLTDSIISAIAFAREEHKNHEQLRDGLNAIMDKKTGLAILQGGILTKTSMKRLQEIRNELDNFIKERDENLLTLIHTEKSKEARAAINAGAKVDWSVYFKLNYYFHKGPLKVFIELIKADIQNLIDQLDSPEVRSLINTINQKTKYISGGPKYGLARRGIINFFHQQMLAKYMTGSWTPSHTKDYLRSVKTISEALDLARWDMPSGSTYQPLPKRKLSSDFLESVKEIFENYLNEINLELMTSVADENSEQVKLLVERGAEVNHVNSVGETPLSKAILSKNLTIIGFLLVHGARLIEAGTEIDWRTIESLGGEEWSHQIRGSLDDPEKVDLKDLGPVVDSDLQDAEGYTPLMNAVMYGRFLEAEAILNTGVTMDWRALLLKLQSAFLSMQRQNVYHFLQLLSYDDIDALVSSFGEEDTDRLIEKLNNQTSVMDHWGYNHNNNVHRKNIRNKLVGAFKEKDESKDNLNFPKVLDKVLAKLLIIQGKGSKNGVKTAMHELQLLSKKLASQHQEGAVDEAQVTSESIRNAIVNRDLDKLKSLIDENPECIDRPCFDGLPPLLVAARENCDRTGRSKIDARDKILPYLIERGAKIDWDAFSIKAGGMFPVLRGKIIFFLCNLVNKDIEELFKFESQHAVQALIKRINEKTQHLDIHAGHGARLIIRSTFTDALLLKKRAVMGSKDLSFLTSTRESLAYLSREMHIIQRTVQDGEKDKKAMRELNSLINTTDAAISEVNFQRCREVIKEDIRELLHLTNTEAIKTKIDTMNEDISSLDATNIKKLREEISPYFIDLLKKRRADLASVIDESVLQSVCDCFNRVLNTLTIIQSSDDGAMDAVRQTLNSYIEHWKGRMDQLAGLDKLPAGRRPTVFSELTDAEIKAREEQLNTGFNDMSIFGL